MFEKKPMNENETLVLEEDETQETEREETGDEDPTDEDNDDEDDEFADWDSSCLEDEELVFEGSIEEECFKGILFLVFQTLLFLKPELRDLSLEVVFYSGMEAEGSSPYLCEDETTQVVVPLLADLLNPLILEADPIGCTYHYNDGPLNHPDGYSPSAERISFLLKDLGDVTAREILLSPDRLTYELQVHGFDLRKFKLGQELLAKGCKLEAPSV